jgi:chaperonin GroES
LVRRIIPEAKTASGLILSADTSSLKANEATVIAVGPGALSRDGARIAVQVKEGDKVLLPEYGGTKVKLGEEELFLFNDADILGKFQ